MKWKIGNYELKYNPTSLNNSNKSIDNYQTTALGVTSNPNRVYGMASDFQIHIYDKPSYTDMNKSISCTNNFYVSLSERTIDEKLFILRADKKIDSVYKDGSSLSTITITGTASATLPTTSPIAITHIGSSLAILYSESGTAIILITDENGVANRKYTYSNINSDKIESISSIHWDFNAHIYALSPYGRVFMIDYNTGTYTITQTLNDFNINISNSTQPYSSIIYYMKNGYSYLSFLQWKKYLLFFDINTLTIINKAQLDKSNIINLCFSSYSNDTMLLMQNGIYKTYPNTCRLDLYIIENMLTNGIVTIYDDYGMPKDIIVSQISTERLNNKNEQRYTISISADILHNNQTFNGKLSYISR